MKFIANEGKQVEIEAAGDIYLRHTVKTRFVTPGEDYIELMAEYISGIYESGDIVSISEKIIAICQHRIVRREDIVVGGWAQFLSRFASQQNHSGCGVGLAIKMQYAINKIGLPRVLWASIAGGFCKLLGIKGVFYAIAGQEVSGLDGFYDGAWAEYLDIGIEIPANPTGVCNEIRQALGISCMIVDANDFGQEILGKSDDIRLDDAVLKALIRDNPAGQGQQCTPLVLIRRARVQNADGVLK